MGILVRMLRQPIALCAPALLLVAAASACGTPDAPGPTASVEPVAAVSTVPGTVSLVDPDAFAATIATGIPIIVDVRTPEEFAAGRIQGAVNLDVEDLPAFTDGVAELDPAQTYAVYCRTGSRSATATDYLVQVGFTSVIELDGGIVAWAEAGLPVAP